MLYFIVRALIAIMIIIYTLRYAKFVWQDHHKFGGIGVYFLTFVIIVLSFITELSRFHLLNQ